MNIKPLWFVLALCAGLAIAPRTQAVGDAKGLASVCSALGKGCVVYSVNPSPAPSPGGLGTGPGVVAAPAADLDIHYRYSGPDGTGKQQALDNGAVLHSGDKFSIRVEPRRERWLYLFHFDSAGQLNELVSLSGHSNRLEPGKPLDLPAADAHFALDARTGWETIHTIVAPRPLDDLFAAYRSRIATQAGVEQAGTKGVVIMADAPGGDSGRTLACLAEASACRETFRIRHEPRQGR